MTLAKLRAGGSAAEAGADPGARPQDRPDAAASRHRRRRATRRISRPCAPAPISWRKLGAGAKGSGRRRRQAARRRFVAAGQCRAKRCATRRKRPSSCRCKSTSPALREALQAQTVTQRQPAADLARQWIAPDGKARVEVSPKGDTNDTEVLRSFARAVLAVYPNAIGGPISILKSGDTVVRAFIEAGIYALLVDRHHSLDRAAAASATCC